METLIGFAFGYWVGTRHGREGLQRALDTAREIYDSPEARRIAGQALSTLSALPVPTTRIARFTADRRLVGIVRAYTSDTKYPQYWESWKCERHRPAHGRDRETVTPTVPAAP
jgi:hypothetical protein